MKKDIKKKNPSYSAKRVNEIVGDIWDNELSESKRKSIIKKHDGGKKKSVAGLYYEFLVKQAQGSPTYRKFWQQVNFWEEEGMNRRSIYRRAMNLLNKVAKSMNPGEPKHARQLIEQNYGAG